MGWDLFGRKHKETMQAATFAHEEREADANRKAQAVADALHYQNEEKKRIADERQADKQRASQERIEKVKYEAEKAKADAQTAAIRSEHDLKVELAQKQVDANAKEQEELTKRTKIEEEEESNRLRMSAERDIEIAIKEQEELTRRTVIEEEAETSRAQIAAERDVAIAKSADETSVRLREQQRLENQFLESEITKRGELTLEYMKEELKMLDKERERKHLEFEKLIDSTRQKQRELQESFDKTGNIELIAQISDCETTLKQYIAKDKRDEKEYNSNKLIINEKINQLFIGSDSGEQE